MTYNSCITTTVHTNNLRLFFQNDDADPMKVDHSEAPLTVHPDSEMSGRDSEETVRQEESRLRIVHPTAEDVPGCMSLLDDFLSCNSACFLQVLE